MSQTALAQALKHAHNALAAYERAYSLACQIASKRPPTDSEAWMNVGRAYAAVEDTRDYLDALRAQLA